MASSSPSSVPPRPHPHAAKRLTARSPLLLPLLLLLHAPRAALAVLPTAAVDVILPNANDAGPGASVITLLASQASFGGPVARYDQRHGGGDGAGAVPAFPPEGDEHLCAESEGSADYSYGGDGASSAYARSSTVLLVPRGGCSFERKALSAQRLGASAVIVYGTLGSRYSLNYTNSTEGYDDARTRTDYGRSDVVWPAQGLDYECGLGSAHLPASAVEGSMDFVSASTPGGYDVRNDDLLTGTSRNNLCVKYDDAARGGEGSSSKSFANSCESQRCLVTGINASNDGTTTYGACCAWDLHVWLYGDASIPKASEVVTIPAVYLTMGESAELLDLVRGAADGGGDPVVLTVYERYRPEYNVSAVLIWAFGVFVAWVASYHSSGDIRRVCKAIVARRDLDARRDRLEEDQGQQQRRGDQGQGVGDGGARPRSRSTSPPSTNGDGGDGGRGAPGTSVDASPDPGERTVYRGGDAAPVVPVQGPPPEESLELTAAHALGFIVMASTSLLVLFFLKIYSVVKVMYAFGCSGAFAQVVVHPGLTAACRRLGWERPLGYVECLSDRPSTEGGFPGRCRGCLHSFFGPVTPVDLAAMVISYGVGAAWLYVAFAVPHPDTITLYWVVQDLFGLCMCVLFLETIKLNAIKVGAILLVVAFFYDIFFVFVTPLLTKHGESIMVNVATSGGPPKADPSWCEKYPTVSECRGGDPLPMLFAIPRIGDYQGGCSMLGLGDIVLPGLLLSFASRYDESKRLMGLVSGGSGRVANNACPDAGGAPGASKLPGPLRALLCCCGCCQNGYFGPVMIGYAIGLLMANAAVYIMEMGQPALLYLVPCCLGTMVFMGHRAGELQDLWEGPRVIRAADRLMYGEPRVESAEEEEEDGREEGRVALVDGMSNEEEAEMT